MDYASRLNEILDRAFELKGEELEAYLEVACSGDNELRKAVETLLAGSDEMAPDNFMEAPIPVTDLPDLIKDSPSNGRQFQKGHKIGEFRVVERIGAGGMGEVYLAERDDGQFDQKVAIKVVKAGMATEEVLRRFHYERQILANLEHPNIARLLHGGLTQDGMPYFVMEYVEGTSITEYCDEKAMSVRERLELFKTVCGAVRYAQRNLVVHRDLKPGNILVTKQGEVKLLDFGIAKLLGSDNDPVTVYQTLGHVGPLTPAYAAPEQVQGLPINAATDVYALGVILYELLTGKRPYNLEGRGLVADNVKMICEKVPSLPSSVVSRYIGDNSTSHLSKLRSTEPARLRRVLSGDIDAVVMQALKKEPERRYASASELYQDIERYLESRPVAAQNDSIRYRTFKFIERNLVQVAVVSFAVVAVMVGLISALNSSRVAQREATFSTTTLNILLGMFEDINPKHTQQQTIAPRQLVSAGLARIEQFEAEPLVKARVIDAIGQVSLSMGDMSFADSLLNESRMIREVNGEVYSLNMSANLFSLGVVALANREFEDSEAYHREALAIRKRLLNANHPDVIQSMNELAFSLYTQSSLESEKGEEAKTLYEEAMSLSLKNDKDSTLNTAKSMVGLGHIYVAEGNYTLAEDAYRQGLHIQLKVLGDQDADVSDTKYSLAVLLEKTGNLEEAATLHQDALDIVKGIYGEEHYLVAGSHYELGRVYQNLKSWPDAQYHYEKAAIGYSKDFSSEGHLWKAYPYIKLGEVHIEQQQYDQAEVALSSAIEYCMATGLNDAAELFCSFNSLTLYGLSLSYQKREEEANVFLQEGYDQAMRYIDQHPHLSERVCRLSPFFEQDSIRSENYSSYKNLLNRTCGSE